MKKLLVLIAVCGVVTILSCSKDETEDVRSQMEDVRGSSRSGVADSLGDGKVRIGDVVIDTTWNGETHINF